MQLKATPKNNHNDKVVQKSMASMHDQDVDDISEDDDDAVDDDDDVV